MAKYTLKILRCKQRFLKYVWPFFDIMHERVKRLASKLDRKTVWMLKDFRMFSCFVFKVVSQRVIDNSHFAESKNQLKLQYAIHAHSPDVITGWSS